MPNALLKKLVHAEPHPTGLGPSRWILAGVVCGLAVLAVYTGSAGWYAASRTSTIQAEFERAKSLLDSSVIEQLVSDYPLVDIQEGHGFAPFHVIEINDAGRALANAGEARLRESRKAAGAPTPVPETAPPTPQAPTPSPLEAQKAAPLAVDKRQVLKEVVAASSPGLAAKFFGYEQLAMYAMAALAIYLLASQIGEVGRQRQQLLLDGSVFGEARFIRPEDAGLLVTRLQQGDARTGTGRFVVTQLLRRFERTGEIDSAAAAGESAIDAVDAELVARLNVVRFAIWAIPTVGFIGTVRGIGGALALASSPEQLPAVVGFLGVAFDTTMVGLLLCLVVVLVSHELERRSDRFLDELSSGAVGAIQRRLRQGGGMTGRTA